MQKQILNKVMMTMMTLGAFLIVFLRIKRVKIAKRILIII